MPESIIYFKIIEIFETAQPLRRKCTKNMFNKIISFSENKTLTEDLGFISKQNTLSIAFSAFYSHK